MWPVCSGTPSVGRAEPAAAHSDGFAQFRRGKAGAGSCRGAGEADDPRTKPRRLVSCRICLARTVRVDSCTQTGSDEML